MTDINKRYESEILAAANNAFSRSYTDEEIAQQKKDFVKLSEFLLMFQSFCSDPGIGSLPGSLGRLMF
jgi:hypothetical protein